MNYRFTKKLLQSTLGELFFDTSFQAIDSSPLDDVLDKFRVDFMPAYQAKVDQESDQFSIGLEALDKVYSLKVTRQIIDPVEGLDESLALINHVQSIVGFEGWDQIADCDLLRYKHRFDAYAQILRVERQINVHKAAIVKENLSEGAPPESWKWILSTVRAHPNGIGWSELLGKANSADAPPTVNPVGKSKFSGLISNMRLAGWLKVTSSGRNKLLRANPSINLASTASREAIFSINANEAAARRVATLGNFPSDLNGARNIVCGVGAMLLSYLLLSGEKHKRLRTTYSNFLAVSAAKKTASDPRELIANLADMYGYLSSQTSSVAKAGFGYLSQHFNRGPRYGRQQPRLSVKVVQLVEKADPLVLDLARDHTRIGSEKSVPISANTGFETVQTTGRSLLINNIPEEIFEGRYKNPRLRTDTVSALCSSKSFRHASDLSVMQWRSLWKGAEDESGAAAAYKSTLIVPITMRNNPFDGELKRFLRDKDILTGNGSKEFDRAILGFLCFDHTETDYFTPADEDIGYVVADLLSLFLMIRYSYTELSETFKDSVEAVNACNRSDDLMSKLREQREKNSRLDSDDHWHSFSIPKVGRQTPFGIDRFFSTV
jgi:hypothetical protein